jgi:hypothetical protein
MVKYMFLLYGTGETLPEPGTAEFTRMRADWTRPPARWPGPGC